MIRCVPSIWSPSARTAAKKPRRGGRAARSRTRGRAARGSCRRSFSSEFSITFAASSLRPSWSAASAASCMSAMPDIDWSGPVVEEEREPPALVLLGGDEALGRAARARPRGRAPPRAAASSRPRGRRSRRARSRACGPSGGSGSGRVELEVAEPLAVDGERDDHALAAGPRARRRSGRPGRMRALRAPKSRFASSQVRSRISAASSVEETAPIESTSDSRKRRLRLELVLGVSWRRRSVTIR